MSINERLKMFIDEHDIDQKELARIAGVTEGEVSQWLSGTTLPKIGRLQKITEELSKLMILPMPCLRNLRTCRRTKERFAGYG